MNAGLVLDPLSLRTADDFAQMSAALSDEDPGGEHVSRMRVLRQAPDLLAHPELARVYLVREDAVLVGMVMLAFTWSNELGGRIVYLDEIYVRPEHRGRALAGRMIDACGRVCAAEGCTWMQLEVAHTNVRARHVYQGMGFTEVPRTLMGRPLRADAVEDDAGTGTTG